MSRGPGTPSRERTKVVLCSSRMMSMHSSTHSSQMKTVGPAISLRTSCWLFPQNEQYRVFFESLPLDLFIRYPFAPRPAGFGRLEAMLASEESSAQRLYAAVHRPAAALWHRTNI